MLKKIAAIILCVVFISISFTGCGNAANTVNKAIENTKKLDSMLMQMDLEVTEEMKGNKVTIPLTAYISANDQNSKKPLSYTTVVMSMMGKEIKMSVYQEGEDGYVVIDDMKYKAKISDDNSSYDYKDDVNDIVKAIPKEFFKGVKSQKAEDGSVRVELSVNNDKFSEIYSEFIEEIMENTGVSDDSDTRLTNAKITVNVKDKYVLSYGLQFDLGVTVNGTSANVKVNTCVTYSNHNEKIQITPPEDYKNFVEIGG